MREMTDDPPTYKGKHYSQEYGIVTLIIVDAAI